MIPPSTLAMPVRSRSPAPAGKERHHASAGTDEASGNRVHDASSEVEDEPQSSLDAPQLIERETAGSLAEPRGIDGAGLLGEHASRVSGNYHLRPKIALRAVVDVGSTSQVDSGSEPDWTTTAYR